MPVRQTGSYLLEALIAILIFSFGVLGLIGLLGSSIRITNDARYRSEAANLANAMIAEMWTMTSADADTQVRLGRHEARRLAGQGEGAAAGALVVRTHGRSFGRTLLGKPNGRGNGLLAIARRIREAPTPDDSADRQEPDRAMMKNDRSTVRRNRGVGLMEVMISIVIGMLLVLVIYQVYEVSESQKRTITAGSDAHQNATYGLYVLGRDLAMAGNGLSSAATELKDCLSTLRHPISRSRPCRCSSPAGGAANVPDAVTVFYGGSSSLSTAVQFKSTATTGQPYVVPGPVGFSANADPNKTDAIVAVQGANCTLSTVNAGGVAIDGGTGFATLTHTPVVGAIGATYSAVTASLVNLGPASGLGRIAFTVDTTTTPCARKGCCRRRGEPRSRRGRRRQSQGAIRPRHHCRRQPDHRHVDRGHRRLDTCRARGLQRR